MAVPNFIDDGNWSLLQRSEGGDIEFPFSEVGDNETWKQNLHYKIHRSAYRPRKSMTKVQGDLGFGYLTKLGDLSDCGCGLVEWKDRICSLPSSRIEPGTFSYTLQWWRVTAETNVDPSKYFYDTNFDIEEQTFTVSADVQYEYFLNIQPPPLIKPRVFLLFGFLQTIGGTPILGNRLVAEDSQVSIYEGRIFERRTVYVKVNNVGQPVLPP